VVAVEGVRVRDAAGGQWALVAERRGLLRVHVPTLAAVNILEGISVYTLYDFQVVDAGEVVARAKVTPLVIPEAIVREAEQRSRAEAGLVTVRPFRPLRVAAVAGATLEPKTRDRFEAVLGEKLAWLGGRLARLDFVAAEAGALAETLEQARSGGAEVVVVAGANALDPLDPIFAAVERLGGRFVRRGVPAHPGSLLWLAVIGKTPILGMPACGMFSQATLFDLLLPRLLAGESIDAPELGAYGHGGLLGRDMAFRFPPYRAGQERGALPE
jgi:molybdopterin biosynthesis enzyme